MAQSELFGARNFVLPKRQPLEIPPEFRRGPIEPVVSLPPLGPVYNEVQSRPSRVSIFRINTQWKEAEDKHHITSLNTSPAGILIVSGIDLADPGEAARKFNRQMKRLEHFGRVQRKADQLEIDLDGKISEDEVEDKRAELARYQRITKSWNKIELSQESDTQQIAENILNEGLPQEKDTIEAAERLIKSITLTHDEALTQAREILFSPPKPDKERDPNNVHRPAEVSEQSQQEQAQKKEAAKKEEAREREENNTSVIENHTIFVTARGSEDIYVHDPEMDEPDSQAAEFFAEIWDTPF